MVESSNQLPVVLNKANWDQQATVVAVHVPVREIGDFSKRFKAFQPRWIKFKPVVSSAKGNALKLCLMREEIGQTEEFVAFMQEKKFDVEENHKVDLTYENFTSYEILKASLPKGIDIPTGFETVGDIAHMNLFKDQMPYKQIIGQVLMDKNPNLRSIVTKIGYIQSEFRFYDLECIAGDATNFETTQTEDKVRFRVDISKMYWCSKLATERSRMIAEFFKPGQVLCDMMCGIGPQAIKAAVKVKDFRAIANDLNPEAVECMKKNIQLNKVKDRVLPHCMDGRAFIRMVVDKDDKSAAKQSIPAKFLRFDHVFMNLPMIAVEFLDSFIGLFNNADKAIWTVGEEIALPMVHVYGFTTKGEKQEALDFFVERIGKAMNFPEFSEDHVTKFHQIRDVSNTSHMFSTSFKLPAEVAFAQVQQEEKKQDIYGEFEDKTQQKKAKKE